MRWKLMKAVWCIIPQGIPNQIRIVVKAREDIAISGSLVWVKTHRAVNQDLELLFTLGLNQAPVEYRNSIFNGSIISPATPGNYPIDISLKNAPNGATIVEPIRHCCGLLSMMKFLL